MGGLGVRVGAEEFGAEEGHRSCQVSSPKSGHCLALHAVYFCVFGILLQGALQQRALRSALRN